MFKNANELIDVELKVLKQNEDRVTWFISNLNKIASKLNLPGFEVDHLRTEESTRVVRNELTGERKTLLIVHEVYHVRGQAPVLEGWTFLGTLAFEPGKPLPVVRTFPGQEVPPQFFNTDCHCDHCNTTRFRNEVYVLEHVDGRLVQVGSSCVKDFVGHGDVKQLLDMYALWGRMESFGNNDPDENFFFAHGVEAYDPFGTICDAIRIVNTFGYVSRKKVEELRNNGDIETIPSSQKYLEALNRGSCPNDCYPKTECHLSKSDEKIRDIIFKETPDDEVKALARQILEEAKNLSGDSSYVHNLKNLANATFWTHKDMGFGFSMVLLAEKIKQRLEEAKKPPRKESSWIGYEGEKVIRKVTVNRVVGCESYYGPSTLYSCIDEDDNIICFFSQHNDLGKENETITVKGTIKKRDEYKGKKQTVLTRVKVVQ